MKNYKDPFNDPFFTDTTLYFKKVVLRQIILSIISVVGFCFLFYYVLTQIQKADNVTSSFVGKQVVIEKDTMTVIDYSTLKKTYTLSNGIEYEMKFVQSNIIK